MAVAFVSPAAPSSVWGRVSFYHYFPPDIGLIFLMFNPILGLPIHLASVVFPFLPLCLFLLALFRLVISPRNRRRYPANSASLLSLCPAPPIPSPSRSLVPQSPSSRSAPPPPAPWPPPPSIASPDPVCLAPALSVLCVVPLPLATDTYHVQTSPSSASSRIQVDFPAASITLDFTI